MHAAVSIQHRHVTDIQTPRNMTYTALALRRAITIVDNYGRDCVSTTELPRSPF